MDKYSRRTFISNSLKGAAGLLAVSIVPFGISKFYNRSEENTKNFEKNTMYSDLIPLPIPILLKNKSSVPNEAEFDLTVQMSKKNFIKGKETNTLGYNGDYPGPVIRVKKGDKVSIKIKNNINEDTTVHWHGLQVDGENDVGPHNRIKSGGNWNPGFTINQPAATLWYHPHPHLLHKAGEQVYKGLAGLFYIDDDISDSLPIPKKYGVNDIPLIIEDKKLDSNGKFEYKLGMHDVMMSLQGGTILVNGTINPYLEVPSGKMSFRLLNGSNARFYEFLFSDNQRFYQIASDGGFLEKPVEMTKLILSPGERAEIIVDFSEYKKGDVVELTDQGTEFMKFVVTEEIQETFDIPDELAQIERIDPSKSFKTRSFVFQGMCSNVNINGKQMDMDRIDEYLDLNTTEIWEISNESSGKMGGMAHPFHAHGTVLNI
ncbi:multicopper oxidase family protein [Neobacillus mesonae]|uniref:multicopper oxidase family protein n=1 Tax=Neobacillus mesonae TaxID=1193713 RepID=UPI002040F6A5|nr:multicopper oxidase domain-containing protein [Neobacillus mesonae]